MLGIHQLKVAVGKVAREIKLSSTGMLLVTIAYQFYPNPYSNLDLIIIG